MERITSSKLLFSLFFFIFHIVMPSSMEEDRQTYIIHVDKSAIPSPFSTHHDWYTSTLSSLSSPDGILPTHLYTYTHVMDGFSAVLSKSQVKELETMPSHIATYPEAIGHLHTTHSPTFLGLTKHSGVWPESGFGDDMIIGIIDSGVWPESKSFNDHGMPPVPKRWRGACESGEEFNSSFCNRKLIGARYFNTGIKQHGFNVSKEDYDSPRDSIGHGTHTSSTAAGSRVPGANYFGYAKGNAIGVAPMARLAMYKLFPGGNTEVMMTDTLAGMDRAIADGVDLMSLSLGFPEEPFYNNPIALGAFAAIKKGIFVACSAGNSGPNGYTIFNGAPWITTIGAGTIDRDYIAIVALGDGGAIIKGRSVYPGHFLNSSVPLYYGYGNRSKEICDSYALNAKDVQGKIIFCDFNEDTNVFKQISEVNRTGALGAIFSTNLSQFMDPYIFFMPFIAINPKDGELVKKYIISSEKEPPLVNIKFQITVLGTKPAPQVAYFSSRGPYRISPWILKPDILAPGVNILAAWAPNRGLVTIANGYLHANYALLSGTSMSSPHAIGVAALLKAIHRDWSPAAIRSAMMTTADLIDNLNEKIIDMETGVSGTPLDFGAGHINPNKAMDPGLVYDIQVKDYIDFLCGLNYTEKQLNHIIRRSNYRCKEVKFDLNYPSFIVILNNTNSGSYSFKRVLTNVDDSSAVYHAVVMAPSGMKVVVEPITLIFPSKYSKAEYTLTVEIDIDADVKIENDYIGNYGYLSWYEYDGKHVVRSPIVSAFVPSLEV